VLGPRRVSKASHRWRKLRNKLYLAGITPEQNATKIDATDGEVMSKIKLA